MNKRIILIVAVLLLVAAGIVVYLRPPKSERIRAEMSRVLDSNKSDHSKVFEFRQLEDSLASAYVDEGKYDLAIAIYERQIENTRERAERERSMTGRRSSASYALESAEFELLAITYTRAGYGDKAKRATEKAASLQALADRAAKSEPKTKSVLD